MNLEKYRAGFRVDNSVFPVVINTSLDVTKSGLQRSSREER